MEPIETEIVAESRVACNGGGGPSGHPKVYLTMGAEGHVDCPYCGKRFVLKEGAAVHAH